MYICGQTGHFFPICKFDALLINEMNYKSLST